MSACPSCSTQLAPDARFCPRCGQSVASGQQPTPAEAAAPLFAPQPAPLQPQARPGTFPQPQPPTVPVTAAPRAKRSRGGRAVAAVVLIGALVAGGFVAYRFIGAGNSDGVLTADGRVSGGASSPEDAVQGFADALAARDLLAAVTYIAPDEVDGLSRVIDEATAYLDAHQVPGLDDGDPVQIDLQLEGLSSSPLAEHAAAVTFELSGSLDAADLGGPLGTLLPSDASFSAEGWPTCCDGDTIPFEVVTVQLAGDWYVSPMLSLGHLVVEESDLPHGDYSAIGAELPKGAASPEAAVSALVQGVADFDVDAVAANLGGGEGRFVRVFQDAIEDLVDEIPSDVSASADVDVTPGDDGEVTIDGVSVEASDSYGAVEIDVDADCVEVEEAYDGDTDRACVLDDLPTDAVISDKVVVDTQEEDGSPRVRLVPAATRILSELVPAFDRSTLLYVIGAEFADDATPISTDGPIDVDFDGAMFQVLEFPVADEVDYTVEVDGDYDDYELYFQDVDGLWGDAWSVDADERSGTARLVVWSEPDWDECDVWCLPEGRGSATVWINDVQHAATDFPAVVSGRLGPYDAIVLDLNVTGYETVSLSLTGGDVSYYVECCDYTTDGNVVELVPGQLSIEVWNNSDQPVDFTLTPTAL